MSDSTFSSGALSLGYIMGRLQEPFNLTLFLISAVTLGMIFYTSKASKASNDDPKHPDTLAISEYNLDQLKEFDGTGPTKLIFIGIKDKIYDVTEKPQFYGPEGPYGAFSGRDATMALAKNSTTSEFIPKHGDSLYDLSTLDDKETEALDGWVDFFDSKYQVVGSLKY